MFFFFFFNDTATTEIYTLSLHDALPICAPACAAAPPSLRPSAARCPASAPDPWRRGRTRRAPDSERPAGPLTAQCLAVSERSAMNFFVGLDWARQAHGVCGLDATGQVRWQGRVPPP